MEPITLKELLEYGKAVNNHDEVNEKSDNDIFNEFFEEPKTAFTILDEQLRYLNRDEQERILKPAKDEFMLHIKRVLEETHPTLHSVQFKSPYATLCFQDPKYGNIHITFFGGNGRDHYRYYVTSSILVNISRLMAMICSSSETTAIGTFNVNYGKKHYTIDVK